MEISIQFQSSVCLCVVLVLFSPLPSLSTSAPQLCVRRQARNKTKQKNQHVRCKKITGVRNSTSAGFLQCEETQAVFFVGFCVKQIVSQLRNIVIKF